MFEQRLAQLEARLLEAEREVQALRGELHAARQRPGSASARRAFVGLGLIALLALLGTLASRGIDAGGKSGDMSTVKAPFRVVDKSGKAILSVEEDLDGGRGIVLRDREGAEAVLVRHDKDGKGEVKILDAKQKDQKNRVILGGDDGGVQIWNADLVLYKLGGPKNKAAEMGADGLSVYGKNSKPILNADAKEGEVICVAPFRVTDKAEKKILSVEEDLEGDRGLAVHDKNGAESVYVVNARSGRGMVKTLDSGKKESAILGGSKGGLHVWKGEVVVYETGEKKAVEISAKGLEVLGKGDKPMFRADREAPEVTTSGLFRATDKAGKAIMSVEENFEGHRGIVVRDKGGEQSVLVVHSSSGNGAVKTIDSDKNDSAILGGSKGGLHVWKGEIVLFQDGEKKAVEIAAKGLRVFGGDDQPVARVGADADGGMIGVGKAGKALVSMFLDKGGGILAVRDGGGNSIVELGEKGVQVFRGGKAVGILGFPPSGGGAGYLAIANPGGSAVVEAGMLGDGRGVVRAYPLDGKSPIPIPNFIRGASK